MIISVERYKIIVLLKLLLGSRGQDLEGGGNVTGKPSNYPPRGRIQVVMGLERTAKALWVLSGLLE